MDKLKSPQQEINPRTPTRGRMLARNTLYNLIGQLVPMVFAVAAIPVLIGHLGTDRFAILTIAWMLVGYFSLFDMGLGRALTQMVAEKIGRNQHGDIPGILWTSASLILIFSLAGALTFSVLASFLVKHVLKVTTALQAETVSAFYLMGISIPFVILTAACIGVLTAYHRFDIINAIRIPMGIYSYTAPLLVLPFSNSLVPVIGILLAGRAIAFFVHLHYCLKIVPDIKAKIVINKKVIKPLFTFGGWMTLSNVLGPFLVYFDRFLIGSIVSLTAVAYYTTPYEFITKLWIIPGALMNVLFPAFASTYAETPAQTAELFHRAVKYQLLCIFPVVYLIVAFAHPLLALWLGGNFAENSYQVLQWLALGVFINCLAQVPFSFLQGIGKPDVTSKLHVVELLFYLPVIWVFVTSWGIAGAAMAWSARVALDAALLFYITRRVFRPLSPFPPSLGFCMLAASASLLGIIFVPREYLSLPLFSILLIFLMTAGWKALLSVHERSYLLDRMFIHGVTK